MTSQLSTITTAPWTSCNPWTDVATGDCYSTIIFTNDNVNFDCWICKTANDGTITRQLASAISGNPLQYPVVNDQHRLLACWTDDQGFVWVNGGYHNEAMRMVRSNVKGSVTGGWTDRSGDSAFPAASVWTFAEPYRLSDGTILLKQFRSDNTNTTMNLALYHLSANVWTHLVDIASGTTTPLVYAPFHTQLYVHTDDSLHIAFCWNDDKSNPHQRIPPISYVSSTDLGTTWKAIDGTVMATPMTQASVTGSAADTGQDPGTGDNNMTGLTLDPVTGFPVFGSYNSGNFFIAWNGSAWESGTLFTTSDTQVQFLRFRGETWFIGDQDTLAGNRIQMNRFNESFAVGRPAFRAVLTDFQLPNNWISAFDRNYLKLHGVVKVLTPTADMMPAFSYYPDGMLGNSSARLAYCPMHKITFPAAEPCPGCLELAAFNQSALAALDMT